MITCRMYNYFEASGSSVDSHSYLNDIHDTEDGKCVDHTNVGMEIAGHSAQGDDGEEANEQRDLNLVEGVMVDVVKVLPARPVDTGVREEGDCGQEG